MRLATAHNLNRVFYYGCDGTDDYGWGCVYRNIQTVCSACEVDVPNVEDIAQYLAVDITHPCIQKRWIEPPEATRFLKSVGVETKAVEYSPCKWSIPNERFSSTLTCSHELENMMIISLKRTGVPIIIDDGVYSYALVEVLEEGYMCVDPHQQGGPKIGIPKGVFEKKEWMLSVPVSKENF